MSLPAAAVSNANIFNRHAFGAVGNGKNLDRPAIDKCST